MVPINVRSSDQGVADNIQRDSYQGQPPIYFCNIIIMFEEVPPMHLPRGRACNACRRRKMCDGNKPTCNQCIRFGRVQECEYLDVPQPPSTKVLEEHIARLESRIHELEDDPSAIHLHDPHAKYRQTPQTSSSTTQWWEATEPPPPVAQQLMKYFLPHANKFGFFFDINRFASSMFEPTVSTPRPPEVLRNTVYLWGINLSRDPQYTAHESTFVNKVLRSIHLALSSSQPQEVIYVLQAEVLLAYYFYFNSRMIEGKFHSSAAVSLAILCNLHKLWNPRGPATLAGGSGTLDIQIGMSLPPARDMLEEGDRIHAWWTTFILENVWAVALGSPSTLSDADKNTRTAIETPWPLNLSEYNQATRGNLGRTVSTYLENISSGQISSDTCFLSLHAKAALFYEKADRMASFMESNIAAYRNEFSTLDVILERFKQTLPPPDRVDLTNMMVSHDTLLLHTLSQCATIQLHIRFVSQNPTSRNRCLTSAQTCIRLLQAIPLRTLKVVNPIIAVLWVTVSEVITGAIRSLRSTRSAIASSSALPGEDSLLGALNQLARAVENFSSGSPYMHAQIAKFRQVQG
ncbi:hypothetical protein ABKN59_006374 [Abortiporus biennis]